MLVAVGAVAQPMAAQTVGARMTRMNYSGTEGAREFVVFRPSAWPSDRSARSLVVMLHGCTQNADDFARGTRMNAAAERDGFMVLYPEQTAAAHPQKCWNWYVAEQFMRGRGEAALLAGLIDSVVKAEGISAAHVSLVGMSAGAAMIANLGVAYPERYAALAMHSGIPALAATDVATALRVMKLGDEDGDVLGAAAWAAMGTMARGIPAIVLHGAADKVVAPANMHATARQWTVVNTHGAGTHPPVEEHAFDGVGHAWSGGSLEGTYTAPEGPDATALIVAFLTRVGSIGRH